MEEKTCSKCIHVRQHYGRRGDTFREIGCGHCVYPRLKHRKPDTFGCAYFERKEPEEKKD